MKNISKKWSANGDGDGGEKAERKPLGALFLLLDEHLGSVKLHAILSCLTCFLLAFALAGTELFPGTFPFGIAILTAVSGTLSVVSSLVGVFVGSFTVTGVGGLYRFIFVCLVLARYGVSVWLGKEPDKPKPRQRVLDDIKTFFREPKAAADAVRRSLMQNGETVLRENIRVRLALSACAALFTGAWSLVEGGYATYDLFSALFSLLATPLLTYLFYAATSRSMRASRVREIGLYCLFAAVVLSLHGLSEAWFTTVKMTDSGIVARRILYDFGIAGAFGVSAVIAMDYGIHRGVLCGLVCGLVMTPSYAPAYAIGAAVAGVFASVSPTMSLVFGGGLSTAWGIYVGGLDGLSAMFPPIVTVCAVLIPMYRFDLVHLPDELFLSSAVDRRRSETVAMAELTAGEIHRRVDDIAEGLLSVSAVLERLSDKLSKPGRADMRGICESVFTYHCASCKNRLSCKEAKSREESDGGTVLLRRMADALAEDGFVTADVVPRTLAAECYHIGRILDEINLTASYRIAAISAGSTLSGTATDCFLVGSILREADKEGRGIGKIDDALSQKLHRTVLGERLTASSVTAYGERRKHIFVDDIDVSSAKMGADTIRELFESAVGCPLSAPEFRLDGGVLSMELSSRAAFSCVDGVYSVAADELPESVCGDVISSFEADGRYYMILSDGMGTGREAALTSGMVVSLFAKMIKSGADMENTLKLLNQIIRAAGRECSASVDIAEIDLMSGEAKFIKSGAAPSFVIRDGSVFRLQSKTVPIGIIRALDAEMIRFDVQEGDTVVMLSDGAARSYDEVPWLLDMLANDEVFRRGGLRTAAEKIVKEAVRRGSTDDVTAGVVRVGR